MKDIDYLIKQPENRHLEFKEEVPKKSGLMKTIIAFANGSGGTILIGINDKTREIIGVNEDIIQLEERLSNMIFDSIAPAIFPFFSYIHKNDSNILSIKIPPGAHKPYYMKSKGIEDGTFIRVGSTNRKADYAWIEDLRRQSSNISFDTLIEHQMETQQLDLSILKKFLDISQKKMEVKNASFEKLGLAKKSNGKSHPFIGGALMFSIDYPEHYQSYFLKVTRYHDTSMTNIIDTKEFYPPLQSQLEQAYSACKLFVRKRIEIKSLSRKEEYVIPMSSIRELLINAICHRDYARKGSGIQVHIFSDRLEVISPGVLPGDLTINDIGKGVSEIRNRLIVKIFREYRYIEQLGSGINRIIDTAKQTEQPLPVFEEVGNFFKVTLYNCPEKKDELVSFIYEQGEVAVADMIKRFGWHRNTITKKLRQLEQQGKIIKTGKGPSVRYQFKH